MFGRILSYMSQPGVSGMFWLLLGFVTTYSLTRWITVTIRRRSEGREHAEGAGPVKDIYIGGVHIHHQVWGILLVLVSGLLEIRFQPGPPGLQVLAVTFGAGAALALDEFALWLHLDDVYWTAEGRKSIDAVMIALVIGAGLLAGATPLGVTRESVQTEGLVITSLSILINVGLTLLCLLKGKLATGLIGLVVPLVSLVGAIRLAKPESFWAHRRYGAGKTDRARARFGSEYRARRERLRDRLSGMRVRSPG